MVGEIESQEATQEGTLCRVMHASTTLASRSRTSTESQRFSSDCSSSTQTGCTGIADPSNPPWNSRGGATKGSAQPTSQVYVPSDPRFNTPDFSWEARNRAHGSLVDVSYPSPQSIAPPGTHPLAVYTLPGYDPRRAKPYPTVYLSHGYGGNETD